MKHTQSRLPEHSLSEALKPHFQLDPRRLIVLCTLILGMIEKRTVVLYRLVPVALGMLGDQENSVYKRLKRFLQFQVDPLMLPRFVLAHLADEQQVLLILDRTNWKWGTQDINILLLSVRWRTFSFPLVWTLLPHSGNSSTPIRTALIEQVMPLLKGRSVSLTADREFIGQDWFKALLRLGITPYIRLKATTRVGTGNTPVWAMFPKMQPGELRYWHGLMIIYGVQLRVLASKNAQGDTLYLAYRGRATQALKTYALRWNAECLHHALKSRGFDLEATHVTQQERVSTLLSGVALAFIWCCLTGEFEEYRNPGKNLKHGYPPKSIFRRGLDALQIAFRTLDRRKIPSQTSFTQLVSTFVP